MNREKLHKMSQNLMADREDYMNAFRKNLDMYVDDHEITIREIAEESEIPFSTLNSFLYGNHRDCKLSTAVKLARALHVSIDELVGCETLSQDERKALSCARNLSDRTRYLIQWFIDFQSNCVERENRSKIVNVMIPQLKEGQGLYITNQFEILDISHCSLDIRSKVFVGLKILCDYYMPIYTPFDTLLIANDRPARPTENCVVVFYGKISIAKRVVENGIVKYMGIRDGRFRAKEDELDSIIGYVAAVYHDDIKE